MATVHLDKLRKSFPTRRGSVCAVDDLTLTVEDEELLVLVGPSGCGKTTTLRMIAGLEPPTAGRVEIGGREVNPLPPRDRDIAMVFQHDSLYPHMNVFRNIAFGLGMRGVGRDEIRRRVEETAGLLGLQEVLDRKPAALSGGERRRVALGRAVVRRPKVFLLDEPLSSLDAVLRLKMRTEIKLMQRRLGTTMIYVTHDQEEAMTLGDRIAVMRGGALQQCGPPLEVYDRPANRFVAGFIGTPPMNLLRGRLRRDGAELIFESDVGRLSGIRANHTDDTTTTECDIYLGIRPQHIRLIDGQGHEPIAKEVTASATEAGKAPFPLTEGSIPPSPLAEGRTLPSPLTKGGQRGVAPQAEAASAQPVTEALADSRPGLGYLSHLQLLSIEALGDRSYAYLATRTGATITALAESITPASVGKRFDAVVDLPRVHLFAADEPGKRLRAC